ncbi:Cytoplasmic phosphatidylinositol transfer protein 1 [Tupaia chinensis]|uniref:Cytoplasmic phosphatidylinositol transfer protein 1 n=6 Tax=Boreoeutheria TaxID=1437010 RepID=L9KXQ4_TUPCH|nr:Cytoplasmic phosphatidylinositol transfer protein 1 [Tupaia chinensis]
MRPGGWAVCPLAVVDQLRPLGLLLLTSRKHLSAAQPGLTRIWLMAFLCRASTLTPCVFFCYKIGQLYMISKHSHEQSDRGEGVEVVQNEPFEDPHHGNGQFTEKRVYLNSKLPSWARAVVPKIFYVTEKAWNYYPYTITEYTCSFLPKFSIHIETKYEDNKGSNDSSLRSCFQGHRAKQPSFTSTNSSSLISRRQQQQQLVIQLVPERETALQKSLSGPVYGFSIVWARPWAQAACQLAATVELGAGLTPGSEIFDNEAKDIEREVCFIDIACDEIPERYYKESEFHPGSARRKVITENSLSVTCGMGPETWHCAKDAEGLSPQDAADLAGNQRQKNNYEDTYGVKVTKAGDERDSEFGLHTHSHRLPILGLGTGYFMGVGQRGPAWRLGQQGCKASFLRQRALTQPPKTLPLTRGIKLSAPNRTDSIHQHPQSSKGAKPKSEQVVLVMQLTHGSVLLPGFHANSLMVCQDFKDPKHFKSEKTGRGQLREGWRDSHQPIMCSYKLVTVKFEVWGLQTRVEQFVHKSSNTEGISKGYSKNNGPQLIEVWHEYRQLKGQKAATLKTWRQAVWIGFSLVPECGRKRSSRNISQVLTRRTKDGTAVDQKRGFDMTMDEVREFERATQEATNKKIGVFPPAISISSIPLLPSSVRSAPSSAPSTPLSTDAPEFLSVPKDRPRKKSAPETLTLPDPEKKATLNLPGMHSSDKPCRPKSE